MLVNILALAGNQTADNNTGVGYNALAANTTGDQNTAVGANCLDSNTTGDANTGVGRNCLEANTTGQYNTAVGFNGLQGNSTGSYNVAVGFQSLDDNTTANNNTAVGYRALYLNTTGTDNTAVGKGVLKDCTTGYDNTAIGREALDSVTTGVKNTAVGPAGDDVTTGGNNLLLGYNAGSSQSPSGSITTANNQICLGDDNIADLYCADTSISSSDKRDKTDIADFTHGLNWVNQLKPVTYRWDKRTWYDNGTPDGSKKRNKKHIGFLAQDVLAIEGNPTKDDMLVVNLNADDTAYGLKYERLVPVLVNAIKELSAKITALEAK